MTRGTGTEEKVRLELFATKLTNTQILGTSSPLAVVTLLANCSTEQHKLIGRTEVIKCSLSPRWTKCFELVYDFTKSNRINVEIQDAGNHNIILGSAKFELGEVLGARDNVKAKKLAKGGTVFARVTPAPVRQDETTLHLRFQGVDLFNVDAVLAKTPNPFYEILTESSAADRGGRSWQTIYRSEHIDNESNPLWEAAAIPLNRIARSNDLKHPILFKLYSHAKNGKPHFMGEFETSVHGLLESSQLAKKDNEMLSSTASNNRLTSPSSTRSFIPIGLLRKRDSTSSVNIDMTQVFHVKKRDGREYGNIAINTAEIVSGNVPFCKALDTRQLADQATRDQSKEQQLPPFCRALDFPTRNDSPPIDNPVISPTTREEVERSVHDLHHLSISQTHDQLEARQLPPFYNDMIHPVTPSPSKIHPTSEDGGYRPVQKPAPSNGENVPCLSAVSPRPSPMLRPTFSQYLAGGCELELTIAIDFTSSNGDPRQERTLHYTYTDGSLNDYEKAITAVGSIIARYDSDQKFPVFGFGAKFNGVINHCFQVGPSSELDGIGGVLQAYRQVFSTGLTMSGPTVFSQVINKVAAEARQAQTEKMRIGQQSYRILLILTDGEVTNIKETKQSIFAACDAPLSIVIVGIGSAKFHAMHCLDESFGTEDEPGRDICKFVEFSKFKDNKEELTRTTLSEIPDQLVDYFYSREIMPLPPGRGSQLPLMSPDDASEADTVESSSNGGMMFNDRTYGSYEDFAPRFFHVETPPNATPGMRLRVTNPFTHQQMIVQIPDGVPPGGMFNVRY